MSGEIGGLCGLCSRDLPLDRRLLFVAELTGRYLVELVRRPGNAPGRLKERRFYRPARVFSELPPHEWLRDVDSNHDDKAYETLLVPNLPAFGKWWTAAALLRALPLARRVTS